MAAIKWCVFCALIAGCSSTTGIGLGDGAAATDLAGADFAGADFAGVDLTSVGAPDFSGSDLAGYSDVGGPCGGNISNPKQCLPGLVCVQALPDVGGTCANPDAGMCKANGETCASNADCCSQNCIMRGTMPFCCVPGGCP
jgi:hypothetical protein